MEKELFIEVTPSEISIALLEDHRLVELNKESNKEKRYSVGDVYMGKVKKIIPSLNAAFIDIGDEKEAFVHYLDLGINFKAFDTFAKKINNKQDYNELYRSIKSNEALEKEGKIDSFLSPGQPIIVQIVKEPISTKGSRLTAEISIAGRNIVLLPFSDKVNISQKITSKDEKKRLERLMYSILPPNYGVILRTAAQGKKAAVLDAELKSLITKWESGWEKMAKSKDIQLLFTENSRTTTILRDLLNDSFSKVYVNDAEVLESVKDYIESIAPDKVDIAQLYKGEETLFDKFDITRQIKGSFGKVVSLKKGAYLVIEHTEAMHVIDVNSGIRVKQGSQEDNSLEVNMRSAEEIARQMRLRDMGGIIIIDFIDMEQPENRLKLFKHMHDLMNKDRAKHTILPLTKFGLMQITRQRVRPVTEIDTSEVCPTCGGTGKIASSILYDEQLERNLAYIVKEMGITNITLKLNPIFAAFITKGIFNSIRRQWAKKYGCKLKVLTSKNFSIMQAEWYNNTTGELIG